MRPAPAPPPPGAGQYEKLNWRMVSKPGGATVKPDDFYRLYGLHMQVGSWEEGGL